MKYMKKKLLAEEKKELEEKYNLLSHFIPSIYFGEILKNALICGFFSSQLFILISYMVETTSDVKATALFPLILPFSLLFLFFSIIYQIFTHNKKNKKRINENKLLADEISKGLVEYAEVKPLDVVKFDDVATEFVDGRNDWGLRFVFRVAEDEAIVLREEVEHDEFPNDHFVIYRLPESKKIYKVEKKGKKIHNFDAVNVEMDEGIHMDGEPFKIDWEAFKQNKVKV